MACLRVTTSSGLARRVAHVETVYRAELLVAFALQAALEGALRDLFEWANLIASEPSSLI